MQEVKLFNDLTSEELSVEQLNATEELDLFAEELEDRFNAICGVSSFFCASTPGSTVSSLTTVCSSHC